MKKIILITMAIAFLAGCSGPTDQQSQKESTKQPVKAAKQYDPWPKHEMSKAVPMKEWPGGKSREQSAKDLKESKKKLNELLGKTGEGQKE
jgi:hypothetical protein